MLTNFLTEQITRLKTKFGDKAFDPETVKLIFREVYSLRDDAFKRVVDTMISSRPYNRPPMVVDFREARLKEEKNKFSELSDSLDVFTESKVNKESLQKYLKENFSGCSTLHEAVEVRRLQIQLRRVDDPSYDPLKDPQWC